MLASQNRVRSTKDINRVYAKGRFGASGQLSAKVLTTGLPQTRAAVVVSRKISKKAVVRNRIRRRLVAMLGDSWQTLRPSCDIVITVRGDVSQAGAAELRKQLEQALRQAGAASPAKG